MALSGKGETAAEVAAFAQEFRARAVDPGVGAWSAGAIDIVGMRPGERLHEQVRGRIEHLEPGYMVATGKVNR